MTTLEQKFEELKNDKNRMEAFRSWGREPNIIAYIPFRKIQDNNTFAFENVLEEDRTKWFFDYKDALEYFSRIYDNNEIPEYGGLYFVWSMFEDYSYDVDNSRNYYIDIDRIRRSYLSEKYKKEHQDRGEWCEKPLEFTIKCTMKRRWADEFVSFLRYIERNGNMGHSSSVAFYADGDGDFRPKFEISDENIVSDLKPIFLDRDSKPSECLFDAG